MLLSLRFLALLSLVSLSLAASEPAKATPEKHADVKQRTIKRKEICYRNVFGNEDLPEPKYLKPVLTEDGNRKQVWYSDGIKEDEFKLELYYEEFCYRHYKKEKDESSGSSTSTATPVSTGSDPFAKVSFFAGYEEKPVQVASPDDDSRQNLANDRPFKHDEHDSDKDHMLNFFMNFQAGYPGQDRCDEHGCWEKRRVQAQASEEYAKEATSTVQVTVESKETAASSTSTSSAMTEGPNPAAASTKAHDEL